jgi:flavin-dependent dehydrogenase
MWFVKSNLKEILKCCNSIRKALTISQVSSKKKCVENHIIMIGDTAINSSFVRNGMAMAIHSAKLAAENTIHFLENRIDRATLEIII